jgi:hypothetical protein
MRASPNKPGPRPDLNSMRMAMLSSSGVAFFGKPGRQDRAEECEFANVIASVEGRNLLRGNSTRLRPTSRIMQIRVFRWPSSCARPTSQSMCYLAWQGPWRRMWKLKRPVENRPQVGNLPHIGTADDPVRALPGLLSVPSAARQRLPLKW